MDDFNQIERNACPGPGSCSGLFTANTMACLTEALGLSIEGCATAHAISEEKLRQARRTGALCVELARKGIKPRDIVTRDSFENALRVDNAIGGSTNTCLHLMAIAKEFGIDLELDMFDKISKDTKHIVALKPGGEHFLIDLEHAGGIPAVLSRLVPKLKKACTVECKDVLDIARSAKVGIPNPNQERVPASDHRHRLPAGYRVAKTSVLGGLHHDYVNGRTM